MNNKILHCFSKRVFRPTLFTRVAQATLFSAVFIATLTGELTFASTGDGSTINNMRLTLCSENGDKCIEIQSAKAEGSMFASLYSFRNSTIMILNRKNGDKEYLKQTNGYIDFSSNQIVLLGSKDHPVERTLSLANLSELSFGAERTR